MTFDCITNLQIRISAILDVFKNCLKFRKQFAHNNTKKFSHLVKETFMWNSLPHSRTQLSTLHQFKTNLKQYLMRLRNLNTSCPLSWSLVFKWTTGNHKCYYLYDIWATLHSRIDMVHFEFFLWHLLMLPDCLYVCKHWWSVKWLLLHFEDCCKMLKYWKKILSTSVATTKPCGMWLFQLQFFGFDAAV